MACKLIITSDVTAADHITVMDMALAALPEQVRPRPDDPRSPRLLVRTHDFAAARRERGCEFSVGFSIDAAVQTAVLSVPEAG